MTTIPFTKMHGIGNDYIYIDAIAHPEIAALADLPTLARNMSERHTGIGGDGIILLLPPTSADADLRMRMFNNDGSEAEMCGNGIRCVARLAFERGYAADQGLNIQTGAGLLTIEVNTNDAGTFQSATVDMGKPILEAGKIPVRMPNVSNDARVINADANELFGSILTNHHMTAVSMGNPHVIFFCDDVAAIPLESGFGKSIETHLYFPNRINVHFVQVVSSTELTMRTWERGTGITQACGTGACAVCVAGVLTDNCERQTRIHLPGGDLDIHWDAATNHVFMTGGATMVFTGEWVGSG